MARFLFCFRPFFNFVFGGRQNKKTRKIKKTAVLGKLKNELGHGAETAHFLISGNKKTGRFRSEAHPVFLFCEIKKRRKPNGPHRAHV